MTTLGQIRLAIQSVLYDMNLSPYEVTISSFKADGKVLAVTGIFQKGFLGDTFAFKAKFDPNSKSITEFEIASKVG